MQTHFIDMVHHNPGEPPFDTKFTDPASIRSHGFNGQAFKHINTVVTLDAVAPGVFPQTDAEREWLSAFTTAQELEIHKAKAAGLNVFCHIDLFVLPKRIVEHFRAEICDPKTGRIDINRPKTLELHRALFDEIFTRWPEIDGLIIRVGETYLMDTPHHTGNGAVNYVSGLTLAEMHVEFHKLLNFLRAEICEKHDRWLIHRTWDTHPDRFHASLDFYLAVTEKIEPHPKLLFSVKHTTFDFQRFTPRNPCLGAGRHPQVVEVQCQREYEGKGAYANYVVCGVAEGFSEMADTGLKEFIKSPHYRGIYTWTRGGGWHGPYVNRKNEFWCELNFAVFSAWAHAPEKSEAWHFDRVCQSHFGLSPADTAVLRRIATLSERAILKGKLCTAYDSQADKVPEYPTNMWMRDDVLQGYEKLSLVFDKCVELGLLDAALTEKSESVQLWREMRAACDEFSDAMDADLRNVIEASVEYGVRLFTAIEAAWHLLAKNHEAWRAGQAPADIAKVRSDVEIFRKAWADYQKIPYDYPVAPTLYRGNGWHWPTEPEPKIGLLESITQVEGLLK